MLYREVESKIKEHSSQLEHIKNKTALLPEEKLKKIKTLITKPDEFLWGWIDINFLYKNKVGEIISDLNVANYSPNIEGKTTYYVSMSGNNANDGLTRETAFRSVNTAINKSDVGQIVILEGLYTDSTGFNNNLGTYTPKNIIIKGEGDVKICAGRNNLTWTKTSGKNNVYEASRTIVVGCVDLSKKDKNGDNIKMAIKSNIDEVDENKGSYYTDGTKIYVNTTDSRVPDENILVLLDVYNYINLGACNVYFENIKFYGGKDCAVTIKAGDANNISTCIAYNCEFKYATGGYGGFGMEGCNSLLVNCLASCNYTDGFNYHRLNNIITNSIEINCVGRSNGIGRGTNQDNGSTTHQGGKAIRINCTYYENEGPNLHDINANTQSWMLGCEIRDSKATNPLRSSNYRMEEYANCWIDGCIGYGSINSLYASETCTIRLRESIFDKKDSVYGTIVEY